jgi:dethiobiotin synthetase
VSPAVIAISGTGTNVGKTYVATALTLALAKRGPVAGVKPYESGHDAVLGSDQRALAAASTTTASELGFALRCFPERVAPPEAARRAGAHVDLDAFFAAFQAVRARFDGLLVVEFAGGLFSPFDDVNSNAEVLRALAPEHHLLVAPNRLGVLHEARATVLAARAEGVSLSALVVSHPLGSGDDASCRSNVRALEGLLHSAPIVLGAAPITAAAEVLGAAWDRGAFRRR